MSKTQPAVLLEQTFVGAIARIFQFLLYVEDDDDNDGDDDGDDNNRFCCLASKIRSNHFIHS
jgi:hypothetical protein